MSMMDGEFINQFKFGREMKLRIVFKKWGEEEGRKKGGGKEMKREKDIPRNAYISQMDGTGLKSFLDNIFSINEKKNQNQIQNLLVFHCRG